MNKAWIVEVNRRRAETEVVIRIDLCQSKIELSAEVDRK